MPAKPSDLANSMATKTTMAFGEAVRIATASLWAHKLRSVLTLLGVVIGVTSVIAVVSIVNGLNRYVAEKVFNLGADVFLISRRPAIITNIDQWEAAQKRRKFTIEDYVALRDDCGSCEDVAGIVPRSNGQLKFGMNYISNADIRGWTPRMPRIYDINLIEGRHITEADMLRAAPVCTIGYDVADKLFAGVDPVGKEIRLDEQSCVVIGVGEKRGSVLGQSRDNWVIIPLTWFQAIYGSDDSVMLWVKAGSAANLQRSIDEARQIMRGRRHVAYNSPDDFVIETNDSFLSLWAGITSAFFAVILAIAGISLIVGGIVIMNIMLVSVTERTREIGLRKSIGARRNDILVQFLIESSTIAAIGGLWGVLLGMLLAKFVSWISPLPSAIEPWSVLAGFVMATSVGLFFGVYPASKAAKLSPVEALRSE